MNCPRCNQNLKDDSRFCTACGFSLEAAADSATIIPQTNQSTTPRSSDPLLGKIIDSKYELLSHLGQGGMGVVYRARRVHIGDEVAVKVLHSRYVAQREATERFKREARAAAQLRHPNVVVIYDYGEAPELNIPAYIVMELVEGESLGDILDREVRLPPQRAIALLRQICSGVGAAHKRNIIHRDLKPDNIVVLPPENEGDDETVKVVDFGLAKLRDMIGGDTLTMTGTVMGTPYYMSPEQCRGEDLDPRSDVYSLGAILYEMLAGKRPFVAPSAAAIIAKHLTESPPSLAQVGNLPPHLITICDRALAKSQTERPSDALAFLKELTSPLPTTPALSSAVPISANDTPGLSTVKISGDRPLEVYGGDSPAKPLQPVGNKIAKLVGVFAVLGVVILAVCAGIVWFLNKSSATTSSPGPTSTNNERTLPANANSEVTGGAMPGGSSKPTTPTTRISQTIMGNWRNRSGKLELRFQDSPTGIEGVILKVPDVWPANRVKVGDSVFVKGKVVGKTIEGLYINLPQKTDCQNLETRYSKCVISFESNGVMKVTNSAWQYSFPECKWSLVTYDDTWNWYKN
jgi:serine/threonine protein kinase